MWVPPKATTGRTPAEVSQGPQSNITAPARTRKVKWVAAAHQAHDHVGEAADELPRLSRGLVRNEVAQILQCAGPVVVTMMIGVQETT